MTISKYINIFEKSYSPNSCEEVYAIKNVNDTVPWTYVINDLNCKEVIEKFYEILEGKSNRN